MLSKYYPGSYFGYDREGAPVFIDPVGEIDFRGQLKYGMTYKSKETVFLLNLWQCGRDVWLKAAVMYLLDLPGPRLFKGQFCMKGCVLNKVLSDHSRISSVGKALDCTAEPEVAGSSFGALP